MPKFVYITMDGGHNAALHEASDILKANHAVDLSLALYSTTGHWDDAHWNRLKQDVNEADFVFGCMIFGEEYVRPMQRILSEADTPMCIITSNPAVIYCTHLGKLNMAKFNQSDDDDAQPGLVKRWMSKLRPKKDGKKEGHRQTSLIRNLTKLMKYVPGQVRDLHTFIAMHDYWLHSSPENLQRMMALLLTRYVPGYDHLPSDDPLPYPDAALYHPDAGDPFSDAASYAKWRKKQRQPLDGFNGAVGILIHRAVILSGNTAHLDTLIRNIEAQGLEARTVYSAMLDFRPAMNTFLTAESGLPPADAIANGMGFPLVGGPAGARPEQAVAALSEHDLPYYDMVPLTFQHIEDWGPDEVGLNPMQTALNIALPELDGIAEPVIYGGPTLSAHGFHALEDESALAARRIARRVRLRHKPNDQKKLALVLFNFPPNLGNAGTAAFLDVFASVHKLLGELKAQGYNVEVPADVDALRERVIGGNALQFGTDGNVGARISLEDYRQRFPWYPEIEQYWGHAPGELLTDGKDFYILGAEFGAAFVAIQPSFGYERDPMRLLMGKDASPHHGFAAFYTWLDQIYDADAVLHIGTHGALEFMPGKQVGLGADCWPPRLLGALPNFYYYCVNNPSEGSIAKRRGAATLISYMVPPLHQAGLYKGLRRLKDDLDTYHKRHDDKLLADIRTQADRLGIVVEPNGHDAVDAAEAYVAALGHELLQVEHRMIPLGLHVLGTPPAEEELADLLTLTAAFNPAQHPNGRDTLPVLPALIAGGLGLDFASLQRDLKTSHEAQARWEQIETTAHEAMRRFIREDAAAADAYLHEAASLKPGLLVNLWAWLAALQDRLMHDQELYGMLHSLEGGYIEPSPGNDVMRNEHIVPTGRNIHALDPYRIPSSVAIDAAQAIVDKLLARLTAENGSLPETVAMVLWGTDNLKSDGEGIAQCLLLLGARPITDELGNISDVELMTLEELGRPRIDIVMTLSGIFRDLFHHQAGLLDKAVRLAAHADEPLDQNFVRKHTLQHADDLGISVDEAAARVYSNAPGAYGAHVNHLVDSSTWDNDDQLSEAFLARKSFAFTPGGNWQAARGVMERSLATVDAAFQNIDSFEMGISDVDHYYEYLGGVAKCVEKLGGKRPPVMVADAISLDDRLSSLEGMVRLETRAKLLNPKWHESMLQHGYEGVHEIEIRVSNTYGWSATANAVEGWVYDDIAGTFMLDEAMRQRMAEANPHATAAIAGRLLEAQARGFWDADDATLDQLREIYGDLEDQMEGVVASA